MAAWWDPRAPARPMPESEMTQADRQALAKAIVLLEHSNFATRLAGYAGTPVGKVLEVMPTGANRRLMKAVHDAVLQCLDMAVESLDRVPTPHTARWLPNLMTGVTGGLGGFFGVFALPVELPVTTTLMLRAIAAIARSEGEDLSDMEARLGCVSVLALGGELEVKGDMPNLKYYAARAVLARLSHDAAAALIERGAADAAGPIIGRLVSEVVSRFGLVVSEKVAAGALPILGAVGGATVNVLFMDHFQQVARGHFTIRRLERRYGADPVRAMYDAMRSRNSRTSRAAE